MDDRIEAMIDGNAVLLMGTTTCPFCTEAKRALAAYGITGKFIDIDQEENSSEVRKALVGLANNKTSVPQIWIKNEHIGGCDDLKALDAAGDLRLKLDGVAKTMVDAETGGPPEKQFGGIVSTSAAVSTYPGENAAFFAPFHSKATVDHRAVRLIAIIVFTIVVVTAVFAGRHAAQWVVLGLAVDFTLRLFGFPAPLGVIGQLPFAGTKPHFSAGASKQFASLCGVFMSYVAFACLAGDKPLGGRIVLAGLAMAAFLQGVLDFCLGCFIFDYLRKFGLVSKETYRLHVNTRADTDYAWTKMNTRTGKSVSPPSVTYPLKDLPPNPTDLRSKPGKEDEKWERFHVIKYCHIGYFTVPLGILGLALPWAMLSDTMGTASWVWQVLAWTGAVLQIVLGALYLTKATLYRSKVCKEWGHPLHGNGFAVPFANFTLLAWLCTKWTGANGSGDLARVLFCIGTAPLALLSLYRVASWISRPTDREWINPGWMLMPVGSIVGAIVARPVDDDYVEWGWFLFGTGVLMWLALWPITFQKAISDHYSDFRLRASCYIWVTPPAAAMLAYASLAGSTEFDAVQRMLFYASLALAIVMTLCTYPLNFFEEGNFDMSWWAFAFPLDVLAAAAVVVYDYTKYDTMQVIYVVALTAACVVNAVCFVSTLAALIARHVFVPFGKWSPLSFMKLTHEAFREAIPMLNKLATAVKPGMSDAFSMRELAKAWGSLAKMHDIHSMHEEQVIFPALEGFFPGQTISAHEEHEEHEKLMTTIQTAIDILVSKDGGGGGVHDASRATMLDELRVNLSVFGKDVLEHLDHEEHAFATPIARKYLPIRTVKDIVRSSWEATPNADMCEFLGWTLSTLRMRAMRTRFLKTWVWAMPERAQQLGLMVYRVVDDVTWVEVARDLPEVVPRGLPGHRRYF